MSEILISVRQKVVRNTLNTFKTKDEIYQEVLSILFNQNKKFKQQRHTVDETVHEFNARGPI